MNLIVSAYLDFAELQAVSRTPMHMADWIRKLDAFIGISDRALLTHAGKTSHETARLKAEGEYAAFRGAQAALPQPVDRHSVESLDALKKIAGSAKSEREAPRQEEGRERMKIGWQQPKLPACCRVPTFRVGGRTWTEPGCPKGATRERDGQCLTKHLGRVLKR